MTHLPPSLADFAQRLLVHEAGAGQRTQDLADAMERVCQALHNQLAPLVSAAGFNALLAGVGAITTPNCSFDGRRQAAEGRDPADVADALVAILANFIWLLVLFIGV